MANYTKRTFYGIVIVFIFSLAAALFAYIFRLMLAKKLSMAEFGLFYSLTAFFVILISFCDLGASQAVYYFIPRFSVNGDDKSIKSIISRIFSIKLLSLLLCAVVLVLFSDALSTYYFHSGNAEFLLLFIVIFILFSFDTFFQTLFNSFQNNVLFASHNLVRSILLLIVTFLAFFYFKDIFAPIFASMVTYLITLAVFSFIFFKFIFPKYWKIKADTFSFGKLLAFGIPASLAALGFLLITSTDTLVLTYFRSLDEVGLYNAVVPIISLMLYVPISICSIILPLASELWEKKHYESLNVAVDKITKYAFITLVPLGGILITFPVITINLLFGNSFSSASTALMILAFGAIFYGIALINIHFLLGIVGPKINTMITLSCAVMNLILNVMLVPSLGILGAALATSTTYLLMFIVSSIVLYRKVSFKFEYLKYFLILVSGGIFILAINYLKKVLVFNYIAEAIMVVSIAGAIYVSLMFLFRIITIKDIKEIKEQVFKKG